MGALSLRQITKKFGAFSALESIDLEVRDGEFLTLLGPSGCGKSTLLNIIAGLERPTGGAILIDGQDVSDVLARDRDIAMIFQSYALYPSMSVRHNIMFGLKMRGVPRRDRERAAVQVAEMLRITHLLDRRPSQLSGGQRQRVAMGRALVRNPKVFLFDEPLSNLDAQLRAEMRVEIKRLHQKVGTTVVYVTHDQIEAMTMSTRIVVMNGGQTVQIGTPAEIYNTPKHVFVARFVGSPAMNFLPGRLVSQGDRIVLTIGEGDHASPDMIIPVCALDPAEDLVGRKVKVGIRPESIAIGASGLRGPAIAVRAIDVVEPTGADTLVVFGLAGAEVTARLGPAFPLQAGEQCAFSFDPVSLHLFDHDTEERIEIQPGPAARRVSDPGLRVAS